MLTVLAASLLLTLAFEEGFALARGLRGKRELGLVALVNCLTNPAVVLLYYTATALLRWNSVLVTLVLEAAAVIVEWWCYRAYSNQVKRPFVFALSANLFSYGAGCAVNLFYLFLWRWLHGQTIINWRAFL